MSSGSKKQAAAQQDAAQQQQIADLEAQQAQLAEHSRPSPAGSGAAGCTACGCGANPGNMDDQMAQIQKLAQMKEQGLITDEEFQARKQILGI